MSKKKAREKLKEYMDAELSGQDERAEAIERELKDGGWQITIGPEGTTVRKIQKEGGLFDNNIFLPKESSISPFKGSKDSNNSANSKPLLIALGITVTAIGVIVLIAYFIKKQKGG